MKRLGGRLKALLLAAAAAAVCAGCAMSSVNELYSLPEMSEEYVQLQELISQRIDEGYAYAAPIGGSNRQSVQLRDLDGDGTAEALAFLADEELAPTVCIYRQNEEGNYYPYRLITGDGSSVYSVDYADLDGDGAAELIIAWQISGDIRLLSVYALSKGETAEKSLLFSADCTDFLVCDMDADGVPDLLDLRFNPGGSSSLVMYALDENGQVSDDSARLSDGVYTLRRTTAGQLEDGSAAVFIDSQLTNGQYVTDVFAVPSGHLRNITLTGLRSGAIRDSEIYAADVDGDGAMDLPRGRDELWSWYGLQASGAQTDERPSFYSTAEGWYLLLTGPLTDSLTIDRYGSGGSEPAVVFSVTGDGTAPSRSVLAIFAITGENRMDRATVDGRFVLQEEGDRVYAAQLMTDELTQQDIIDNFHLIYAQWQTGDF